VRGVEWKVAEPRLLGLRFPLDEVDRRIREDVGGVFPFPVKFPRPVVKIVFLAVVVAVVIEIPRSMADELVETALGRP